jgi:hypothetical protein
MIAWGETITDSVDTDDDLRSIFRQTFETKTGRAALARILTDLGIFGRSNKTPIQGAEEIALLNYGLQLLSYLGMFHAADITRFTNALLDVPVTTTKMAKGRQKRSALRNEQ